MAQPVSANITSTPSQPGQPYDAASDSAVGSWVPVDDNSGPADIHSGRVNGDFPSGDRWQQV